MNSSNNLCPLIESAAAMPVRSGATARVTGSKQSTGLFRDCLRNAAQENGVRANPRSSATSFARKGTVEAAGPQADTNPDDRMNPPAAGNKSQGLPPSDQSVGENGTPSADGNTGAPDEKGKNKEQPATSPPADQMEQGTAGAPELAVAAAVNNSATANAAGTGEALMVADVVPHGNRPDPVMAVKTGATDGQAPASIPLNPEPLDIQGAEPQATINTSAGDTSNSGKNNGGPSVVPLNPDLKGTVTGNASSAEPADISSAASQQTLTVNLQAEAANSIDPDTPSGQTNSSAADQPDQAVNQTRTAAPAIPEPGRNIPLDGASAQPPGPEAATAKNALAADQPGSGGGSLNQQQAETVTEQPAVPLETPALKPSADKDKTKTAAVKTGDQSPSAGDDDAGVNSGSQDNRTGHGEVKKLIDSESRRYQNWQWSQDRPVAQEEAKTGNTPGGNVSAQPMAGFDLQAAKTDSRQAPLPQPLPMSANNADLFDQVVQKAELMIKEKSSEIKIQLHPEILGKMTIKLALEDGLLTARFITDNHQVKHMLDSNLNTLRQSLESHGIRVERAEVDVQLNNGGLFDGSSGNNHELWQQRQTNEGNASAYYQGQPPAYEEETADIPAAIDHGSEPGVRAGEPGHMNFLI